MKHDIIDRATGNIVGVMSIPDNDSSMLVADINLAHQLIQQLEERLRALESQYYIEHEQ